MNENETNPTPENPVETVVETTSEPQAAEQPKKKRGRGGPRVARNPDLKDWIRVQKSAGNGLPNVNVHMIVNDANGLVELHTQAPKQEGSDELEPVRVQIFRVTSVEHINDPTRDIVKKAEKPAKAEAAAPEAAPAEVPQA